VIAVNKNKGFTLVELLVVIAIIGILASLITVSIYSARNKARDAKVKSDLAQVRVAAEQFFNDNNFTYVGLFGAGTDAATLMTDADTANGSGSVSTGTPSSTAFCASAQLATDSTNNFCVDSTGVAGEGKSCGSGASACS